jgi:hypothetical protein
MPRAFRVISIAMLALMPAACSEFREVRISGDLDRPVVFVTRPGSSRAIPACVDWIAVFDAGRERGPGSAVWRVRSATDECVEIEAVIYGETPEGFVVDTPPGPLRAGTLYEAAGHGWTTGFLPRVPWAGGGRFAFSDGAWRTPPSDNNRRED